MKSHNNTKGKLDCQENLKKEIEREPVEIDALLKFIYSEKATKIYEIYSVDLSYLGSNGQIYSGGFAKFCGLLGIY